MKARNTLRLGNLRWLIDPPLDGVTNMARDEALLQLVGRGESPPTLRFYGWTPPTVSLGYFQAFADFEGITPPAGELAVVRRQTGGGAILHDAELTYALVLPHGHPLIGAGGANGLYNHVHGAAADLLRRHGVPVARGPVGGGGCSHGGPFFCFERHSCFDLLADGRKLMGSAQRRTGQAVLQHGSLVIERRFEQQTCAAVHDYAAVDMGSHLPRLAEAIATPLPAAQGSFSAAELALAEQLRAKYADPAWTKRR